MFTGALNIFFEGIYLYYRCIIYVMDDLYLPKICSLLDVKENVLKF